MDALFAAAAIAGVAVVALAAWQTADSALSSTQVAASPPSGLVTCRSSWLAAVARWLSCGVVCAVFLALRLGTLRIYSTGQSDNNSVVYNHRETDERVFEVYSGSVTVFAICTMCLYPIQRQYLKHILIVRI